APVPVLRAKYDSALADGDPRIVGLAIGTRADCVSEEIADLLAEYARKYYLQIELGLQTSDDQTARRINRGYESKRFTQAVEILRQRNLNVVTHILLGLPGETKEHIIRTVDFLNRHDIQGIKIHSLYVLAGTRLAQQYQNGEFEPITMAEYVDWAVYVLTHISPKLIVHRISGDCAREMLVAPEWIMKKKEIMEQIIQTMEKNGWKQGEFFSEQPFQIPSEIFQKPK
ncbi:MAG: TIGR01212 family radical SAM protein, partial [Planctomycetia bacterium]|nr:TIGR01212 family radical SAM protein [Planctomycetia bacterium]